MSDCSFYFSHSIWCTNISTFCIGLCICCTNICRGCTSHFPYCTSHFTCCTICIIVCGEALMLVSCLCTFWKSIHEVYTLLDRFMWLWVRHTSCHAVWISYIGCYTGLCAMDEAYGLIYRFMHSWMMHLGCYTGLCAYV